jgi:hypothetical protein
MIRRAFAAGCGLMLSVAAASADTVTVSLTSPQDGQSVSPGATINWQISFTVSGGDNAGLALLIADLTQDPANPDLIDIPPATGVPGPMSNFSRPAGISNPGEGGPTGYVGVQRGTAGEENLIQIGGGQNTFGIANAPGSGIGENANVVGGVGQSGAVVLASGSFLAPAATGTYSYALANVVANTLDSVSTPPAHSPVDAADIVLSPGSISFTVGSACPAARGDVDCSGGIDFFDIDPFLLALFDLATYQATYCGGSICTADVDCSTAVDFFDIDPFLACLFTSCPPCP